MEFITTRGARDLLKKEGIVHPQTHRSPSHQQILDALRRGMEKKVVKSSSRMTMTNGKTHILIDPDELLKFYREHPSIAFGKVGNVPNHECAYANKGDCKGRRIEVGRKRWVCEAHMELTKPEGTIEK